MRAAGCVLVGLVLGAASASQTAPQSSNAGPSKQDFLDEAYLTSLEMSDLDRPFLMGELVRISVKVRDRRARSWIDEAIVLAGKSPLTPNRLALEKNLVTALSFLDSSAALDKLGLLSAPVANSHGFIPEDVRAFAARTVFEQHLRSRGVDGVSRLRAVARQLGENGLFPFAAMSRVMPEIRRLSADHDWADLEIGGLFGEAVEYYSRGSAILTANEEFVGLLEKSVDLVPAA